MAAVAVMAAGGGYFLAMKLSPSSNPGRPAELLAPGVAPAPENLLGQRRPDFSLADATGQLVAARSFDGQVLLVNFWATWCAPCVEEMPMLSQLQRDYAGQGVAVVGIALDEPRRALEFARELGVDYPVLFGLADAMVVGRRYGNRSGMLPYSVLVDEAGVIRWTRLGILDRGELETQIAALRQEQSRS
jgi:thiol-disulfide isomerase/thioredoxin